MIRKSDIEALKRMLAFEEGADEKKMRLGWGWEDVKTYPAIINKLMMEGLVECTYRSNRYRNYKLTERGIAAAKGGAELIAATHPGTVITSPGEELEVPDTLFSEIIGYGKEKTILRESLLMDKKIHVLLYGPPSIAKTMFLVDIEQVTGSQALPLLGSGTSRAGMWDLLAERQPKFLLIDELEKMSTSDMAGLLSLMETGRIIRAKVGRELELELDCRVFATANRINRLPSELLSRFWKRPLTEYSASDYAKVVQAVLINREGTTEEAAYYIAMKLVGKTHDVRDAIRVARMAARIGVEDAVELWLQ